LSLFGNNFVYYIIIVGIVGAACVGFSFVLLNAMFGIIGTIGSNPISHFIELYLMAPSPDLTLVIVATGFGFFALILNVIIGGAAIKFTLDEYGGTGGDIGSSYSHSFGRLSVFVIYQLLISTIVAVVVTPTTILASRLVEIFETIDLLDPVFPPGSLELMTQVMLLFIVGGLILVYIQIRLAPTIAIILDTDLSVIDSLKKSWELTSGHTIHVFVGMLLFGIVSFVLSLIVSIFSDLTALPTDTLFVLDSVVSTLLFGALSYIYAVVLYRDLSSRQDTSELPGFVM
jgi:hypothetical protein